jgi:hypothetical protein
MPSQNSFGRVSFAQLKRQLVAILKEAGCYFLRQGKGDHEIWFSPVSNRKFTLDAGITSNVTANIVLKQAGLPKHF